MKMGDLGRAGGFVTVAPLRIDRVTKSTTNSEATRQWINHPRKPSISSSHLVVQRIGTPLAIVADGAVELRESAVGLKNEGKS